MIAKVAGPELAAAIIKTKQVITRVDRFSILQLEALSS